LFRAELIPTTTLHAPVVSLPAAIAKGRARSRMCKTYLFISHCRVTLKNNDTAGLITALLATVHVFTIKKNVQSQTESHSTVSGQKHKV
jgi:hypothetical protein